MERVNAGLIKMLNEAYLKLTDRGTDAKSGSEDLHFANVFVRVGLEELCKLRREHGDGAVYETVGELDEGARVLPAAQAVRELDELGYHVEVEDDEDDLDDWPSETP